MEISSLPHCVYTVCISYAYILFLSVTYFSWAERLQIMTNIKEAQMKKVTNIFFVNIKCSNKIIATMWRNLADAINIIYDTVSMMP